MTDNILFGIVSTLLFWIVALKLYQRTRFILLNPFLVSFTGLTTLLLLADIPLSHYMNGGQYLLALLPFTVILLGLPLHRRLHLLKAHRKAILAGIIAGVTTSAATTFIMAWILDIDGTILRSLLPKSITTPLGLIVSETLGGLTSITVISIIVAGMTGALIGEPLFKLFRIKHPVAQGIAMGTASHAIGTSKAMEMGEDTGAMSSLALILAGVTTVAATPVFLLVLMFI